MYTRSLPVPKRSFFLFGPRGTGKTTWLKEKFKSALWFDLLHIRELLKLMQNSDLFRQKISLFKGNWIVIDEIQKFPALLNEVHSLMADKGNKYRFAMTGSSARKLKRLDVNLLAGRAINRKFFPLTGAEMEYEFNLDDLLQWGCLPAVRGKAHSSQDRVDILEAYVENYIRQEIQQEALVKNLDSFSRFLEIAGLMNGQMMNQAGIARDAAVARTTVEGYFNVLIDTLLGFKLPAWKPRAKVKEIAHSKFYLFDPGVVRALSGRLREPLFPEERGFLLETIILHEIRAWMNILNCGGQLFYWRTPTHSEVDFIWCRGGKAIGIEVKASHQWKREYGRALHELKALGVVHKCYGVYTGKESLKDNHLFILPIKNFMKALSQGAIFL